MHPIVQSSQNSTSHNSDNTIAGRYELDMRNQALRSISSEIRYFTHLTALHISNNRLTLLPDELFLHLRALTTLDVSCNNLTSLPSCIGKRDTLRKLLIQQNKIIELPVEMGRLFQLKELQLDGNPLSAPPSSIIQQGTLAIIAYLRDRMPTGPPRYGLFREVRKQVEYYFSDTNLPNDEFIITNMVTHADSSA